MNNTTTMNDLLKPLIDQGFEIKEKNTLIPTFVVEHNGKEHTFVIGYDRVDVNNLQPSPEGVILYYTDVVKELSKQIDEHDWSNDGRD